MVMILLADNADDNYGDNNCDNIKMVMMTMIMIMIAGNNGLVE